METGGGPGTPPSYLASEIQNPPQRFFKFSQSPVSDWFKQETKQERAWAGSLLVLFLRPLVSTLIFSAFYGALYALQHSPLGKGAQQAGEVPGPAQGLTNK